MDRACILKSVAVQIVLVRPNAAGIGAAQVGLVVPREGGFGGPLSIAVQAVASVAVLAEADLPMVALAGMVVLMLHYLPVGWGWGFLGFGTLPSGETSRGFLVWGKLSAIWFLFDG